MTQVIAPGVVAEVGVEVQLCAAPDASAETYVLCRSQGRADKERAIRERFTRRLEEGLARLQSSARRGPVRSRAQAERRVGRLLERHARAAKLFDVAVTGRPDPQRPGQRLSDRGGHDR